MGRKKTWRSLYAVTEAGETRYGISDRYDGLEEIALRLYENAADPDGNGRPCFDRLEGVEEVPEHDYRTCRANPDLASLFRILAEIDADKNEISVYERKDKKYEHFAYPLDSLIEQTGSILQAEPEVTYDTLKKLNLYQHLKTDMQASLGLAGPDEDGPDAGEPDAPVQSM